MAQYLNFFTRRFFQTSAVRQAAKAGAEENHEGKSKVFEKKTFLVKCVKIEWEKSNL